MLRMNALAAALTAATALFVVAGCGSTASSGSASSSASASQLPTYATALQQQIPEVMKSNAIPGADIFIKAGGKGDWRATFGTSEVGQQVPMSMDYSFRIGSNTKTMTSTVILQLAQEGKLKLTDPISMYEPGVPNGKKITITQLSDMRSGLYSYTFDKKFNETLDADPQKAWTPDELLAIAFSHPPTSPPGQQFEYCNTNIVLLGKVIEKLTGMSASDAFQKRIFDPLKLTRTSLPVAADSTLPSPHAQGYQFGTNVQTIDSYAVPPQDLQAALNGTLPPINYTNANPSWAWTAGGAISTVDDLATYVKAMVGGGLLNPEMQQLRLNSILPTGAPGAPAGMGYGLGLVAFAPGIYGHDGQLPGYSTVMTYDPKNDITIIIGTNLSASPVNGANAATVLLKPVIATLYGAAAVPGGDPAAAPSKSAG